MQDAGVDQSNVVNRNSSETRHYINSEIMNDNLYDITNDGNKNK